MPENVLRIDRHAHTHTLRFIDGDNVDDVYGPGQQPAATHTQEKTALCMLIARGEGG